MAIALLAVSMVITPAQAQTPRFRIINIAKLNYSGSGFIPDIDSIGSMGINNHGEVVFARSHSGTLHPCVWIPQANPNYNGLPAGLIDLFDRSGETGIARDISDAGLIVGQNGTGTYGEPGDEAGAWNLTEYDNQQLTVPFYPLGSFEAVFKQWSGANAVNNDDPPVIVAVGSIEATCAAFNSCTQGTQTAADVDVAFLLEFEDPLPSPTLLSPSLFNSAYPTGVSSYSHIQSLEVVGYSQCHDVSECGGIPHGGCMALNEATYWPSMSGVAMDAIAGSPTSAGSRARGMSDNGRVVGWAFDTEDPCLRHAAYWESTTATLVDLSISIGGNQGWAEGVNNCEYPAVVGQDDETDAAILWEKDENGWTATDLNNSIECGDRWFIRFAHDINDNGWIAVIMQDFDNSGAFHAGVLVPYAECPGEQTCDGIVGTDDLIIVINNWGSCPSSGPCPGDLDEDGDVDTDDMLIVINNWGICPAGSSSQSFGSGSNSSQSTIEDILQFLHTIPELPEEMIEQIETLLGL